MTSYRGRGRYQNPNAVPDTRLCHKSYGDMRKCDDDRRAGRGHTVPLQRTTASNQCK